MKTKPLVSWAGGKTRLLKRLLPHIPEHAGYIEVFAGGCALLLAKPPSRMEVVNDVNGNLVTLYKVAKHHPDALARELELLPASRDLLRESNELLRTEALTDLQRAARFLYANKTSFSAGGGTLAIARDPRSSAFIGTEAMVRSIHEFSKRMNRVIIENVDFRRIFKLYDHPDNFMFIDPPYLDSDGKNYRGWNEFEMASFAAEVKQLKSRWIVTVDDSVFNRDLWQGYRFEAVSTRNGSVNQAVTRGARFGEIIVFSHQCIPLATSCQRRAA